MDEVVRSGGGITIDATSSVLSRIDDLFRMSNQYSTMPGMDGLRAWHMVLNSIARELSPMMDEAERKEVLKSLQAPWGDNPAFHGLYLAYYQMLNKYEQRIRVVYTRNFLSKA